MQTANIQPPLSPKRSQSSRPGSRQTSPQRAAQSSPRVEPPSLDMGGVSRAMGMERSSGSTNSLVGLGLDSLASLQDGDDDVIGVSINKMSGAEPLSPVLAEMRPKIPIGSVGCVYRKLSFLFILQSS
jgi:hypothetical protein